MEFTQTERDAIVFDVTEKVLLRLPEVMGNLMKNHAETNALTKKFHNDYPEFKNDPGSVQSVVGQLERDNAGMLYEDILRKAAPMIKERMKTIESLDIDSISERSKLNMSVNGEL